MYRQNISPTDSQIVYGSLTNPETIYQDGKTSNFHKVIMLNHNLKKQQQFVTGLAHKKHMSVCTGWDQKPCESEPFVCNVAQSQTVKISKMGEPYNDTFPNILPHPSDPHFQQYDVSLHIYVSEWIFVTAVFSGTIHINF